MTKMKKENRKWAQNSGKKKTGKAEVSFFTLHFYLNDFKAGGESELKILSSVIDLLRMHE